jgi:two-component system, OmpR family, sensor histidine kinase KdpD
VVSAHPELESLRSFEIRSAIAVPIRTEKRIWGTLTLLTAESGRRLDEDDVHTAEQYSTRIGLALENARLYSDLKASAADLSVALTAKDEFLGLVSHELRTPLTMLKGMANVLRRRSNEIPSAEQLSGLLDIERNADQLQRIVENMLLLARAEHGLRDQLEPILLERIIESTVREHQEQFPDQQVRLEPPEELLPLLGHEGAVRQILWNLLSNATKYGERGTPIEVALRRVGEEAIVSVSDRGDGLSAEMIEQVFEPFFRGQTQGAQSGIGLGLTVCKRLVEGHGGRIWAEPRSGGGTSFRFALPVAGVPTD